MPWRSIWAGRPSYSRYSRPRSSSFTLIARARYLSSRYRSHSCADSRMCPSASIVTWFPGMFRNLQVVAAHHVLAHHAAARFGRHRPDHSLQRVEILAPVVGMRKIAGPEKPVATNVVDHVGG